MRSNTAVWLTKRGGLEIGPEEYTPPRENEIVVRKSRRGDPVPPIG